MFLLLLVIVTVVPLCKCGILFDAEPTQKYDPKLGYFSEIQQGASFTLYCRDEWRNEVMFSPENIQNNAGFNLEQFTGNTKRISLEKEMKQHRKAEATVADSGLYVCSVKGTEGSEKSIYIFVKGEDFFVPKKSVEIFAESRWFTIPCTSSWRDTNVTLFKEGEKTKYEFVPTRGFRVHKSMLSSNVTYFTCIHDTLNQSISFLVRAPDGTETTSSTTSTTISITTTPEGIPSEIVTNSSPAIGKSITSQIIIASSILILILLGAGTIYFLKKPSPQERNKELEPRSEEEQNLA